MKHLFTAAVCAASLSAGAALAKAPNDDTCMSITPTAQFCHARNTMPKFLGTPPFQSAASIMTVPGYMRNPKNNTVIADNCEARIMRRKGSVSVQCVKPEI